MYESLPHKIPRSRSHCDARQVLRGLGAGVPQEAGTEGLLRPGELPRGRRRQTCWHGAGEGAACAEQGEEGEGDGEQGEGGSS